MQPKTTEEWKEQLKEKAVWSSQCSNIKVLTLNKAERLIQEAVAAARREEREQILGNPTVQDFVFGTEDWVGQMEKMEQDKHCMICGIVPNKLKELAEALTPPLPDQGGSK